MSNISLSLYSDEYEILSTLDEDNHNHAGATDRQINILPISTILKILPFSKEIEYRRHYKFHLRKMVGPSEANKMLNIAIFIMSVGSNDLMKIAITNNQPMSASQITSDMHRLDGWRFALVGVPPVGCLPIVRTLS
ncbi:GDSL esterase/lipase [Carex littledalei]|uniref:GDSL esterase/lipase n=1 Tax=Carex littledalei TaxID=544730 RepID=A0A833RB42_9POAL|nr:GDSL esterase/lipase [Carex littledalei]